VFHKTTLSFLKKIPLDSDIVETSTRKKGNKYCLSFIGWPVFETNHLLLLSFFQKTLISFVKYGVK